MRYVTSHVYMREGNIIYCEETVCIGKLWAATGTDRKRRSDQQQSSDALYLQTYHIRYGQVLVYGPADQYTSSRCPVTSTIATFTLVIARRGVPCGNHAFGVVNYRTLRGVVLSRIEVCCVEGDEDVSGEM